MPPSPVSKYAELGMICGGASTTILAAIHEHQVPMVLLAALVGTVTGLVVGALYGYLKLRRRMH